LKFGSVIKNYDDCPIIREDTAVWDLFKMIVYIRSRRVPKEYQLWLVSEKVESKVQMKLQRFAEQKSSNQVSWEEYILEILLMVSSNKEARHYRAEWECLAPLLGELADTYNEVFMAYVNIVGIQGDDVIIKTYIESLPGEAFKDAKRWRGRDEDGNNDIGKLMEYLIATNTRVDSHYCYVGNYRATDDQNEIALQHFKKSQVRKPQDVHSKYEEKKNANHGGRRPKGNQTVKAPTSNKRKFDDTRNTRPPTTKYSSRDATYCWRCNDTDHKQHECKKQESATVSRYMYAPEHIKKAALERLQGKLEVGSKLRDEKQGKGRKQKVKAQKASITQHDIESDCAQQVTSQDVRFMDGRRDLLNAAETINLNLSDSESEEDHFEDVESDESDEL
jgi:hypothetical protein